MTSKSPMDGSNIEPTETLNKPARAMRCQATDRRDVLPDREDLRKGLVRCKNCGTAERPVYRTYYNPIIFYCKNCWAAWGFPIRLMVWP